MGSVFLPAEAAHSVLRRLRRANFFLEEIKQGNIQRECREETCTYEEAREAFENEEKTRQFWEEYVRESSPPGGLEVGGIHSLYLIVPLLLVVVIIAGVAITVWRCHSRKRSQRSPSMGLSHHNNVLSVVSMDHWGREYHGDQSELSIHSSPAYPGSEFTSGRGSAGDPPPSYEEAVGHTDVQIETEPPPQYEDIVNSSSVSVSGGQGK
ncbi:transmembrane gamma-carboxyglutamic acid protein 1 isoform X2 [Haplochromis burtoni]|nr:transmembrane gamma-carboxyglutamic acid protein 1 isoform X2 [Haplochromis burtoni]